MASLATDKVILLNEHSFIASELSFLDGVVLGKNYTSWFFAHQNHVCCLCSRFSPFRLGDWYQPLPVGGANIFPTSRKVEQVQPSKFCRAKKKMFSLTLTVGSTSLRKWGVSPTPLTPYILLFLTKCRSGTRNKEVKWKALSDVI